MNRILACLDASSYASRVVDVTAWAAQRLEGGVELLHVIQRANPATARHDLSGAIGLGVKSALLEELTRIDEAEGRLAIERGRVLLSVSRDALHARGLRDVVETHRHGGIVETIIEREVDADLVVLGKRGASHEFAADHLGSKVERVLRSSSRPVMLASRRGHDFAYGDPQRIVLAYDGSAAARNALRFVGASALFAGLPIQIVMAGPGDVRHKKLADEAREALAASQDDVSLLLEDGAPDSVIGAAVQEGSGALLVMGAYGHSPLRTLIIGSTTSAMIRTSPAAVLLVRP